MEEEKKMPDAELLSENEVVATPETEAAEAPTVSDTFVTEQEEVVPEALSANEIATEPEAESTGEAEPAAVADIASPDATIDPPVPNMTPDWRFGDAAPAEAPAPKRRGNPFVITFSAVFAVCILLLVATFALGDGSFEIVRTIFTERTVYVREYDSASGLLTPNEAADTIRKSTVTVLVRTDTGTGHGSGFVYSADGYICTNYHVIQDATAIQVMLPDGRTVDAVLKGGNYEADIAVLKISVVDGLVPATIGQSSSLLTGDDVVAVGTPGNIDYAGTSTFGKVSYPNRLLSVEDDTGVVYKKMNLIQTDTSVNPGNSGGPLADMYGKVIGVVVMKISTMNGKNFEGIGFALPIDGVKLIVDEIIQKGSFTGKNPITESRSLLGVSGRGLVGGMWYDDPAGETVKESATKQDGYFQMPFDGIYVIGITGANASGKLQSGDIITAINGMHMYTIYDVINQINRYRAGETVTVTFCRQGANGTYKEHTVEIALIAE